MLLLEAVQLEDISLPYKDVLIANKRQAGDVGGKPLRGKLRVGCVRDGANDPCHPSVVWITVQSATASSPHGNRDVVAAKSLMWRRNGFVSASKGPIGTPNLSAQE